MSLIRYTGRQLPTGVLAATGAIGMAWAVATRLDTRFERTALASLTTVGLSLVCADRAHAMTAASPTPLRRRRVRPAILAVSAMLVFWAAAGATAAVVYPDRPHLGRWDLLQWVVVAASQLAVGGLTAIRRPDDPPIAPGAFVAAVWCAFTAGRIHETLYEVAEHPVTWIALGVLFTATAAAAWLDPARRFPALR